MTALPNWDTGGPTDAELAHAAAGGDRGAFADIYDRYADRLHDFCVGMLRDRDSAADCVQDAFCTAATCLTQLRDPDKLRPWLYAIARNEALRRIRERRRETPSDELPDAVTHEPGPDILAARAELADLIAEAAGGLSDRDRSVLELAYRHGLDGNELAEALGVSPGNANKLVSRLRETIERSLGALLVSRRARTAADACPELAAILGGWDGRFGVLIRKRVARHIESCPTCDGERRRLVTPAALLGATPVFIPAPSWLRERVLTDIRLDSLTTPIAGDAVDSDATDTAGSHGRRTHNVMLVGALLVAALIISFGLSIAWVLGRKTTVSPADVSDVAPKTLTTKPAVTIPSSPAPTLPSAVEATAGPAVTVPPALVTPSAPPPAPPIPGVDSEPPAQIPVGIVPPSSAPPTFTVPTPSSRPPTPPRRTAVNPAPKPGAQPPARRPGTVRPAPAPDPPH